MREIIPVIGLKKGKVLLCDHNPQWEDIAKQTICILHDILGDSVIDIQHIGSTAVKNIQAKPVIDIIVGVRDFADVDKFSSTLEDNGFFFVGYEGKEGQPVYQCGEFDIVLKEMTFLTHYIHIVKFGGKQWNDYINMRDYLNNHPDEAKTYEKIKLESSRKNGESLKSYHLDKKMIVALLIERANEWKRKSMLIDNLFLVHYCHPNCKPFQNIMRLPKEKAFLMAEKLAKENPDTTAFYRFADFANYYPRRLKTDEYLYDNFVRLGGKPKEMHPLSFVLQGCDYLDNWFGKGISYKIKLSEIYPDSVSFSLGDSCAQYEKTGKIQQLTENQLLTQMNDFEGGAENFMKYVSEHYSYIEVQLWNDNVIFQNKFIANV